jgi:addiction module HigA family antidote
MATKPLTRHPDIEPSHPGEVLAEIVIPATGKPKTEIARLLQVSRQTLYDILACRQPVTPTVAVKLGKLFGNGPGIWLRMQAEYDLWHAARAVDTSAIPTLHAA